MTFRKILCPLDFSSGSEQAMRTAVRLAKESGAELVLAYAWFVPATSAGGELLLSPQMMQDLVDDAERGLEGARKQAVALGASRVSTQILTGDAWHELVHLLEKDRSFDLVVIGTHGRTGIRRILLGSVAEKVIRHAPCSVLAVRPDSEPNPYRHALTPVDFSASSRLAAEMAISLLAGPEAELTLLHVIELPVGFRGEPTAAGFVEDLDRAAAKQLSAWTAELEKTRRVRLRSRTRIGPAGAEILALLDEDRSFDLVTMGSHGRSGLRRLLLGSVAEKVVRHARCPVLVARRRAEDESEP